LLTIIIFTFGSFAFAKNADNLYKEGRFAEAEKEYQKGDMDNPKDVRFRYNRGCAAYQNKDHQAAEAAFSSVIRRTTDKDIQFKAAYNLGNTAFTQDDFASAIEFYKQAIILNPENKDAKYNLELSLKKLEDAKNNPEKKDKNKKDKNDKGNQKDSKGKDGKDRDDGANKKNDPKDKSGDLKTDPMDEKRKPELSPAAMLNRKKAEALLDNVKEDRAKILQHQTREGKRSAGSGKNW
jgi:Ca-activated chloride channel family protein